MTDLFPKVVFTGLMLVALVIDMRSLRLPNRIVLLTVAAFVVCAPLRGLTLHDTLTHIATGAVVFTAFLGIALVGALRTSLPLGGGDVKFAGAIALWLGFGPPFMAFIGWFVLFLLALIVFIFALVLSRQFPLLIPLTGVVWIDDAAHGAVSFRKAKGPLGVPLGLAAIATTWLS